MATKKKVVKKVAHKVVHKALTASKRKAASRTLPPVESAPVEGTSTVASIPEEVVVTSVPEMVKCRYCGKDILKPTDSTFYQCDTCEGTGELVLNSDGKVVAKE